MLRLTSQRVLSLISSPSNVTILRSKELLPDLPYPPLHQPQWLASKTIATIAALVAGPEQAKTTILRLTKKPFTPSQCTSCHPLLQKISLHSALKEQDRCGRGPCDVVPWKREVVVLRRAETSGGSLSLPPPIRGKAAATLPAGRCHSNRFPARQLCPLQRALLDFFLFL